MNNSVFQVNDELIVEKGREGMVNGRLWENTGRFWTRGTNTKSRTSASRGTHKVFRSRAKEIRRAELAAARAAIKQQMNLLSSQLSSLTVMGSASAAATGGPLPINEAFVRQVVAANSPNNIVYGQKLSRAVLNTNIASLKEYAMIRNREGIPPAQIAAELDNLHKTKQLNQALAALKQGVKELNELDAMMRELGVSGGKKRTHAKRRHTKRRHTRRRN